MSNLAEVGVEGASRANEGGAATLVGMHFTGRNYRKGVIYLHLKYIRLLLERGVTCGGGQCFTHEPRDTHCLRKERVAITARRIVPCIIRDLPIIVLNESVQLQQLLLNYSKSSLLILPPSQTPQSTDLAD